MKITVEQRALASTFAHLKRIASRDALMLIAAGRGQVRLSIWGSGLGVHRWLDAEIERGGALAAPANLIVSYAELLPPEKVHIWSEEQTLHLACGPYHARVRGQPAANFPQIPNHRDTTFKRAFLVSGLRSAIARVLFAAAKDEARPALTGISLRAEGVNLNLAATDGYRLALVRLTLAEPLAEPADLIIPARALREWLVLGGDEETLIGIAQEQVLLYAPGIDLVSQLIEARYPDYTRLIPAAYTARAVVRLPELRQAVRAVSLFEAREQIPIVHFVFEEGSLRLTTADADGESTVTLTATVEGPSAEITLNARFVEDILKALARGAAEEVGIEISGPTRSAVFRPHNNGDSLFILMPIVRS